MLAPRFRGRVLVRDPLASGVMRTLFGMVLARSVEATGAVDSGLPSVAQRRSPLRPSFAGKTRRSPSFSTLQVPNGFALANRVTGRVPAAVPSLPHISRPFVPSFATK